MVGRIQHRRPHAHVTAADIVAQLRHRIVLADRRHQQHAEQALAFEEVAQILQHRRRAAIERAHHHFEFGIVQRLQHALLDIHHRLRIGIVVDEADQEIAAQRQRPCLRVRDIAEIRDHLFDALARLFVEQGRAVDDPADGLLRYAGDARHIVDRRLAGLLHGTGCKAAVTIPPVPRPCKDRPDRTHLTPVTETNVERMAWRGHGRWRRPIRSPRCWTMHAPATR